MPRSSHVHQNNNQHNSCNNCRQKAISITYLRVSGRACVRVGARVRGRVVRVALLIQHATRMRHIVTLFASPLRPPYFSTLSHTLYSC